MAVLQGLQAISPWACRYNMYMLYNCLPPDGTLAGLQTDRTAKRAKEHSLKGQIFAL